MDNNKVVKNDTPVPAPGQANNPDADLPKPGEFVNGDGEVYEVTKQLGKGTFGSVFSVQRRSDGKKYAMKCEHVQVKKQVLVMECQVLLGANGIKSPHFCKVIDKGRVKSRFLFVVMTLLGKNLWELRREREPQRFSPNTALKVAEQCLQAVRDLHRVGFLHRDLKPPNFAIGMEPEDHTVFIIDFGLCRAFKSEGKDLRQPRSTAPFRGTARYAPRYFIGSAHLNREQGRRDDLEGWLYMVIEFTSGKLPWRYLKSNERDKMLKMKDESRSDAGMEILLRDCPIEAYSKILRYIDSLVYVSIPDYDYVFFLLETARAEQNCNDDDPLDWDPNKAFKGPRFSPERPIMEIAQQLLAENKKPKPRKKSDGGELNKMMQDIEQDEGRASRSGRQQKKEKEKEKGNSDSGKGSDHKDAFKSKKLF